MIRSEVNDMINRDVKHGLNRGFEWPSTTRRRKAAQRKAVAELAFGMACSGLFVISLATLLGEGMWLHLIGLVSSTAGLTYQMIRKGGN